jgi:predicted nucleic acid-binding protein
VAVLIDTDILVDLERGVANPAIEQTIGTEHRAISVITVSECSTASIAQKALSARVAARS